jgi:hypothetical protein
LPSSRAVRRTAKPRKLYVIPWSPRTASSSWSRQVRFCRSSTLLRACFQVRDGHGGRAQAPHPQRKIHRLLALTCSCNSSKLRTLFAMLLVELMEHSVPDAQQSRASEAMEDSACPVAIPLWLKVCQSKEGILRKISSHLARWRAHESYSLGWQQRSGWWKKTTRVAVLPVGGRPSRCRLLPSSFGDRQERPLRSGRTLRCGGDLGKHPRAFPEFFSAVVSARLRPAVIRRRRLDLDLPTERTWDRAPLPLDRRRVLPGGLPCSGSRAGGHDTQVRPGPRMVQPDRRAHRRDGGGHALLELPYGSLRERRRPLAPRAAGFDSLPPWRLAFGNGLGAAVVRAGETPTCLRTAQHQRGAVDANRYGVRRVSTGGQLRDRERCGSGMDALIRVLRGGGPPSFHDESYRVSFRARNEAYLAALGATHRDVAAGPRGAGRPGRFRRARRRPRRRRRLDLAVPAGGGAHGRYCPRAREGGEEAQRGRGEIPRARRTHASHRLPRGRKDPGYALRQPPDRSPPWLPCRYVPGRSILLAEGAPSRRPRARAERGGRP